MTWSRGKTQLPQIYTYVGVTLEDARKAKGLLKQDVAAMVGVSRSTITHMENAVARHSLHLFMKVCRALDLDPGEVLTRAAEANADGELY